MNRLAVLIACLAASTANVCLAEAPAFCTSMCTSDQRECRAEARLQPKEERFNPSDIPERNPFARTAQAAVPTQATRALDSAGDRNRQADRLGTCDNSYLRCTRACAVSPAVQPALPAGGRK